MNTAIFATGDDTVSYMTHTLGQDTNYTAKASGYPAT